MYINTFSWYTSIQNLMGDLGLDNATYADMINSVPDLLTHVDINNKGFSTNEQLLTLFKEYIIPNYAKSIIDVEELEDEEEADTAHDDLLARMSAWCTTTLKYYGVLVKFYTDNENKLLEQIKSTSTSTNKDSDVPQLEGDWDGNDQVSTIASATTTSSVDNGSMMSRLNEIRSGYRDIMQLWSRDFYKNFLMEDSLC